MNRAATRETPRRALCALAVATACVVFALLPPSRAAAQNAWVRGEVRLNLRTGPGTQYRIVSVLTTGDGVQILQRADSWTKLRTTDGKQGWIPEGYLQPEPPPTVRLEQLENRVVELQGSLDTTTAEATQLREANETVSGRDEEQRAEIDRLSLEVLELTAGARWPEWITGASILVVGMIVGAILHRNSTRRPSSRIRI